MGRRRCSIYLQIFPGAEGWDWKQTLVAGLGAPFFYGFGKSIAESVTAEQEKTPAAEDAKLPPDSDRTTQGSKEPDCAAPLTVTTAMLDGIPGDVPLVRIAGVVPPGSEGNAAIGACFDQISQAVDIQSSARR